MAWSNEDPRWTIYKRADIVVIRPSSLGHNHREACLAQVETHHAYSVVTDFKEGRHAFYEGDTWDDTWWWERAHEEKK